MRTLQSPDFVSIPRLIISPCQKNRCALVRRSFVRWHRGNPGKAEESWCVATATSLWDLIHDPGKQIVFVTNNSTKSRADYQKKLTNMGIPATIVWPPTVLLVNDH